MGEKAGRAVPAWSLGLSAEACSGLLWERFGGLGQDQGFSLEAQGSRLSAINSYGGWLAAGRATKMLRLQALGVGGVGASCKGGA